MTARVTITSLVSPRAHLLASVTIEGGRVIAIDALQAARTIIGSALAHASATAEPETYAEGRHDGYISALLEILLWIEEQTS